MKMFDYETKTTFWDDFTIADHFGKDAILDTKHRAFEEWKTNTEYVTELAMVLNWKCWQHYEQGNEDYAQLYSDLYYEVNDWCYENLKGDDLTYYFNTTD